jgi:PIN like domain
VPSTRRHKPPPPKPEFFVDRDLGRYKVPQAIRDLGYKVVAMFQEYPDTEESERDPDWIREQTRKGRVLVCRDKMRHTDEKETVKRESARMFRVASSAKNAEEETRYLGININRIEQRSRKPGPYIYRVEEKRIVKVFPK